MKPRKCRKPKGAYLEHSVKLQVRFQEVDSLGIVWHGHYITYFEDARVAFGKKYGLSYTDIRNAELVTPLTFLSCDFIRPARYDDELQVLARLYRRESARIEFYYEVARARDMTLLATGATLQAFVDLDGKLLLTPPQFMRDFYGRWETHMVSIDE
jgi:acyl-CoA thioester hydrolase